MSIETVFDWNAWRNKFQPSEELLADVWTVFPETLAHHTGIPSSPAGLGRLSDDTVQAILAEIGTARELKESFDYYVGAGELEAAAVLLERTAKSTNQAPDLLQRAISRRQQDLAPEYAALEARLRRSHSMLEQLGVLAQDDTSVCAAQTNANLLFRRNRLGPGIRVLEQQVDRLQVLLDEQQSMIERKLSALDFEALDELPDAVHATILRLRQRIGTFLAQGNLVLARREADQLRVVYESRDASHVAMLGNADEPALRPPFPQLRAVEILDYLRGGSQALAKVKPPLRRFLLEWSPVEWRDGGLPSRRDDTTYPIYEALEDLGKVGQKNASAPFTRRDSDPWRFFLRSLFTLIGKRGLEPDKVEELSTRKVRNTMMGFWLGRCGKELSIKHTFLDPARLTGGLPIILWHRPDDPLCPKPANLQTDLQTSGLNRRPVLVVACQPIAPEDRKALRDSVPTAALLDEYDLLQILFSGDQPEVRARHFARAIARQLPPDLASPYSEQGDVSASMFVGREEILREFLDPQGPIILFGGRKVGKSSIFRQLEHFFERDGSTEEHRIAIYVNAINVVDDISLNRHLLPRIAEQLNRRVRASLGSEEEHFTPISLTPSGKVPYSEDFYASVARLLQGLPDYRFLLLVDEADSLLQYLNVHNDPGISATKRFGWTLRALVQESGGRFDVRFAGFQEISRAAQSPSGPFYNFRRGSAERALKVLDQRSAYDLVVRPLQFLGITFEDASLIDLILDFTGQHPALIQEFCLRLISRTRSGLNGENVTVKQADVEGVWHDPAFRLSVVRAIHLNVDTRNTKTEKILRLVLYAWVQQLMAPDTSYRLPTVVQAADLHLLLSRKVDEHGIDRHVSRSELNNYLSDLVSLGVLEQAGHGFVFHYRYFASLLFHESFGGQISDAQLRRLWNEISTHVDQMPRWQIQAGEAPSVSPFTREDQARLEQEASRVSLVLGAPGTGKSAFFEWLDLSTDNLRGLALSVYRVGPADTAKDLREQLAKALRLNPTPSTWQSFGEQAMKRARGRGEPILIIVDDVETLAAADGWPLLFWESDDRAPQDDGPLSLLARLMQETRGQLRFVLAGRFALARLWVDARDMLETTATVISTSRLLDTERDVWFSAVKEFGATSDVRQRVWEITGGDLRLLSALPSWLGKHKLQEFDHEPLRAFETALLDPHRRDEFPDLQKSLRGYDEPTVLTLYALAGLVEDIGETNFGQDDLAALLVDYARTTAHPKLVRRTLDDWKRELSALRLLQEIPIGTALDSEQGMTVVVPVDHIMFKLLTRTHAQQPASVTTK